MNAARKAVDWPKLVSQLKARNHGVCLIAIEIGVPHSLVSEYGGGLKIPLHHTGEQLIYLWQRVTLNERTALPMTTARKRGQPGRAK